jgi:hypothetical protein
VVEHREDDALATTAVLWLGALVLTWVTILCAGVARQRLRLRGSRRSPRVEP